MLRKDHIYLLLKQRIKSGEYFPGGKLPGEIALSRELGVSRVTLRAALARLEAENLVERSGRSGNYISGCGVGKRFIYLTFSENLEKLTVVENYLVSELQSSLSCYRCSLIIFPAARLESCTAESFAELLEKNDISGIFLHTINFNHSPALLDLVRRCGVPVVEFGNQLSSDGAFASVCVDIRQAFADGVRYLATLGYKKIATIFKKESMRGFTRNSYEDFLSTSGLEESLPLIFDTRICHDPEMLRKLMGSPARPEAFMCFCDATAMRLMNVLQQLDIKVPQDAAVMGISGYMERLFISPPLSIVHFHYDRMAQQAVKLMLDSEVWFMKEPAKISYISHEIVPRGTTPSSPVQQTLTQDEKDISC